MPSTHTQFDWTHAPLQEMVADGLVLLVTQSETLSESKELTGPLFRVHDGLQGMLQQVIKEEKFMGKAGQLLVFRKTPADALQARRVILVGVGPAEKLHPGKIATATEKAVSQLIQLDKVYNLCLFFPADLGKLSLSDAVTAAVDGVHQATYVSLESKEPPCNFLRVDFAVKKPFEPDVAASMNMMLKNAMVIAEARSFAKDLVNMPPNLKSTETLLKEAQKLDELPHVVMDVEDDLEALEKHMPCFFAVARGSLDTDPPKFMRVKYAPPNPNPEKRRVKVALVGKSVVFDTGGYQVKTDNFMNSMKGDMTGGAMALGTVKAICELGLTHVELTAYLAATPNKIDSDAFLPDSILNSTCGKKVEIRHTDAEGRLTLIDAVAKAMEDKPDVIVTVATLTGAAMRAVGCHMALMGNDTAWRNRMETAARKLGEPVQTLDVVEEDFENIKSKLDGADLINTSHSKFRGAQSAAAFVMSGVPESMPLIHLDIAGADMTSDEKATGIAQRTLIQFLLDLEPV
jgi:leucyl aminopeptidase